MSETSAERKRTSQDPATPIHAASDPVAKLDAERIIRSMGWNPAGFRAERARVLERIDRAETPAERQEAIADFVSWKTDLAELVLFALREIGATRSEILRDRIDEVYAKQVAEAINTIRREGEN